eukprot:TRINITY_DN2465_c0_g1_i1.p1 TRINITY_DN2465_c0_g1~~TRINITY_DN2465_c0_g1_i1.p1  ORF type:complete len:169 (-),score=11.12 TRINITY_DN2465_c0_g1_i1:314-820(-)
MLATFHAHPLLLPNAAGLFKGSHSDVSKLQFHVKSRRNSKAYLPYRSVPRSLKCSYRGAASSALTISSKGDVRVSVAKDGQYLSANQDPEEEPLLLSLAKEFLCDVKSALVFVAEQPGQLKYIEWPSFQSTLKTASLTLVLVMLFVIFLSSVDSALSFLLESMLRRVG